MLSTFTRAALAAALALAAHGVLAQVRDSITWNQEGWYRNGLSASEMLDKPVRGENAERIGEVHDIIVDRNGQIAKLVVEVGGFFEAGDQHIGVPWRHAKIGEDMDFVEVPLHEVRDGTYSLFGRVRHGEDVPAALTSWRVNELLGRRP